MKKILIALILLILTLGAVSASDENTSNLTVSENLEIDHSTDEIISENNEGNFTELSNLINDTSEILELDKNYANTGSESEISILKPMTIDGKGHTLNAKFSSKIFNITSDNVTLKNINFINAKSKSNGGAIIANGELTIINCSFISNCVDTGETINYHSYDYTTGRGGAIYTEKNLRIINSTFSKNTAHQKISHREMDFHYTTDAGHGGAIVCFGELYVENSGFSENSASSIYAANSNLINCNFLNEEDSFTSYEERDLTIINSTFENGGLILYTYGNLLINNSIFINNKYSYRQNEYWWIDGEKTLIQSYGFTRIINSTFINNTAGDIAVLNLEEYELINCTFENNGDATILTNNILLDDSMKKTYIFYPKIRNKFTSTYYNSGKSIIIDFVNKNSKNRCLDWFENEKVLRNSRVFDDYKYYPNSQLSLQVSKWKVGTYTVVVKYNDHGITHQTKFKITIKKAPTTVKAAKVTNKYKKSKFFKISVKSNKKAIKNLKLKLKVYTGKKYKTYTVKTDENGLAKFNTKNLKIGKHNVIISPADSNYKLSAKSVITIK